LTLSRRLKIYSELSKTRLTILVVLTAMSGVALSPLPASIPVLLSTALGTTLCSASANTWNQISEVVYDAQMPRTRTRPLVRRALTPLHAACFGAVTGASGVALLWACVNPLTATLGLANIALYAGAYTYLKRRSIANTWVGAVVGAVPPVMGWTACGGSLLPTPGMPAFPLFLPPSLAPHLDALHSQSALPALSQSLSLVASYDPAILSASLLPPLVLAALHFSWQFPHFNALAHSVRAAYARSGYAMLAARDPTKNAHVAYRHSVALLAICGVLVPLSGLTGWAFAPWGVALSAVLVRASWRFWRALSRPVQSAAQGGVSAEKAAKVLWQNSLWYLPVLLVLIMAHKSGLEWGQWTGWFKGEVEKQKTATTSTVTYPS
jgi:protoheme IX farnesyltransferase